MDKMAEECGGAPARQAGAEEHAMVLHDPAPEPQGEVEAAIAPYAPMPLVLGQEGGPGKLDGGAQKEVFQWCYETALEAEMKAAAPANPKKKGRRGGAGQKKTGTEIVAAEAEGLVAALPQGDLPSAADDGGGRRRTRAINMLNAIEGYADPLAGRGARAREAWVLTAKKTGDFAEQAICYAAITQGAARASGVTITRVWNFMREQMAGLADEAWREASAALHGALLRLVADRVFEAEEDSGRGAAEFAAYGLAHRPGRQLLRYTGDDEDRFPDPAQLWEGEPPMASAGDMRQVRKAWQSRFQQFDWAAALEAQAQEMPLHEGHFLERCEKLPLPEVGWRVLMPLVLAAGQLCAAEAGKSRGANISIENIRAVASALACRRARDAVSQGFPHEWPQFTPPEFQAVVETLCATGVWEGRGGGGG